MTSFEIKKLFSGSFLFETSHVYFTNETIQFAEIIFSVIPRGSIVCDYYFDCFQNLFILGQL